MLTITWTWTCDVCGLCKEEKHDYHLYASTFQHFVEIPAHWNKIGDQLVCPNHQIEIDPPEAPDEPGREAS